MKTQEHTHVWKYYDGWLGYESFVCELCGIDENDLQEAA